MKLNNTVQINAEDFKEEDQQTVAKLGEIINPHMQQVLELSEGRVDFENRVETLREVEMTVDSAGKPILNDKIATGRSSGLRGTQVIRALNITNSSVFPTQHPFISYTIVAGGFIQINNITGLQANNKYRLSIIFY